MQSIKTIKTIFSLFFIIFFLSSCEQKNDGNQKAQNPIEVGYINPKKEPINLEIELIGKVKALFMNLGGQLSRGNPVVLMGAMTSSYGIGQVIAPLYSVYFIEKYGNYDYALYLTAFIVLGGAILLLLAKKFEPKDIE